jgi:hypothetical protein
MKGIRRTCNEHLLPLCAHVLSSRNRETRPNDSISFDEIITQRFVIIFMERRSSSDQTAVVVPKCHLGHILIDILYILFAQSGESEDVIRKPRLYTRFI